MADELLSGGTVAFIRKWAAGGNEANVDENDES